jgi:hypothetical protein
MVKASAAENPQTPEKVTDGQLKKQYLVRCGNSDGACKP